MQTAIMENEAVPAPIADDEERWAAVLRRDPAADDRWMTVGESVNLIPSAGCMLLNHCGRQL